MIPSQPMRWTAEPSARRSAPRNFCTLIANGSFKVRRWPEGDRTAGAMASIAPGAASPYPTGIPHPSEPPTSSQPERWRLPWRRRQCQPSTGIVHEKGNKGTHKFGVSRAAVIQSKYAKAEGIWRDPFGQNTSHNTMHGDVLQASIRGVNIRAVDAMT